MFVVFNYPSFINRIDFFKFNRIFFQVGPIEIFIKTSLVGFKVGFQVFLFISNFSEFDWEFETRKSLLKLYTANII